MSSPVPSDSLDMTRPDTLRIIATRHPGEKVVGTWMFDQPKVRIGRSPKTVDIKVDDKTISRDHCIIEGRPDGIWVKDLGSSNGTWVNGRRVSEVRVQASDVVSVGHLRLKISRADEHTVISEPARPARAPVGAEALKLGPLPAIEINDPKPAKATRVLPPWDASTARVVPTPVQTEAPLAEVLPFSAPYAEPGDTDVLPAPESARKEEEEPQVQFEVNLDEMLDGISQEVRAPEVKAAPPAEHTPAEEGVPDPVPAPAAAEAPGPQALAKVELAQVPAAEALPSPEAPLIRPFSSVAVRGPRKQGSQSTVLIVGGAAVLLALFLLLSATVVMLTVVSHHRVHL